MRVHTALEPAIDQALAQLVAQGIICNLACSDNDGQSAYCLTAEQGGTPDAAQEYFNHIQSINS